MTRIEAELVRDSLVFFKLQLDEGYAGEAHKVAGRYVYRRANELLKRLDAAIAKETPKAATV